MSDRLRLLECLRQAGERGVHSHDLRRAGISGNPSERIRELRAHGFLIQGETEWRNGRNGKRWTLTYDAGIKRCACGCGRQVSREYANGHNTRRSPVAFRVDSKSGCWVWQLNRARNEKGIEYPSSTDGGRTVRAHRLYYERLVGPIPDGLTLDHLCRNTLCVNPAHLEPVTLRENILRSDSPPAVNARKTHCDHGHELTPENTYLDRGKRKCRACHRRRDQEYQQRQSDIERTVGGQASRSHLPADRSPGAVGDTLFELPPGRSAALHDHEEAA